MWMTVYPWPETVAPLRTAGFTFPNEPVDIQGDTLLRIIAAGFDVQVKAYVPLDKQAPTTHTLQISPAGRGFGQR